MKIGLMLAVLVGSVAAFANPAQALDPENYKKTIETRLAPTEIRTPIRGRTLVDFGRDAFGFLEFLPPKGTRGAYEVRLGELLRPDGSVDMHPGATIRAVRIVGKIERDGVHRVPLPRDARNTNYTGGAVPVASEHGIIRPFRYAEVFSAPFTVTRETVRMVRVNYPMDLTASSFTCDDARLTKIYDLCKYSMLATSFAGVYVDGDRERIPYEADAYLNQLGEYAVHADASLARHSHEYLMDHPTWPTEWKQHSIKMAWADWMWTGDARSAARCYDRLKNVKLLDMFRRASDGLLETGKRSRDIVDWPIGERDGYVFKPVNTVVNAFHYRNLLEMADLARALGKTADAAQFEARAKGVYAAFQKVFFDAQRGVYVDGEGTPHASLHANAAALAFGLVPQQHVKGVADFCVARGMACSVYFAQYLLEALFEAGRADAAFALMTSNSDRGWLNMLEMGSTITLEAWAVKYKPNLDLNHAWGAAPLNIISRYVLGVTPREPGFAKVRIAPQVGPLTRFDARVPTVKGTVELHLEKGTLTVVTPVPAQVTWGGVTREIPAGRAVFSSVPDLVLAARGHATARTIVTPAQPTPVEKYAAEELQAFLKQTTGVTLAIATDAAPLPAEAILIGATKYTAATLGDPKFDSKALGEDGFRLAVRGPHVVVCGSTNRGPLYGVYEILETYAGCRWYASWHSIIPKRARVVLPAQLDVTQRPAFLMRQPFWYDVNRDRLFAARLRVNGYNHTHTEVPAKVGGDSFRFGGGLGSCHTFGALLPVNQYFDKHPEYFSLVKGRRIKDHTQLCLTNPDVLAIVTSNVLARIRKDPGAKFYGVSQNDWYNYCECPKCAAIDKEEDSHAGTMIRFVNAVAERVEKEFPDVIIETLAYQYTRKPPKKTRLRHNVVPCLCTIECDFARSLDKSPYPQNIAFRKDISGWKTQTDQLYVWDYTTDFPYYTLPFANVYALQDNVRFFRDNNVKELFEQGAYEGYHADFAELKAWLLAKWLWNPELPMEPLLQDFFNGYYGKAAPFVRAYFDELHAAQREWSKDPKHPLILWYSPVSNPVLTDAFLEKAASLWAQAAAAVKDDPVYAYNVRMGAFSIDNTRLERALDGRQGPKLLWLAKRPVDQADLLRTQDLARRVLATMDAARHYEAKRLGIALKETRGISLGEWNRTAPRVARYRRFLEQKPTGAREPTPSGGRISAADLVLAKPGTYGEVVTDPKAEGRKVQHLFNTHFEWCSTLRMSRIEFEPNTRYRVRARIRIEKQPGAKGEAFWAGVWDYAAKTSRGGIEPKTDAVSEDYKWYDICTWQPRASESVWLGPGRFGKSGKSNIKGMWIDQLEFVPVK